MLEEIIEVFENLDYDIDQIFGVLEEIYIEIDGDEDLVVLVQRVVGYILDMKVIIDLVLG